MIPDDHLKLHKGIKNARKNKYVDKYKVYFSHFLISLKYNWLLKIYHKNTNLQKPGVAELISKISKQKILNNIILNIETYHNNKGTSSPRGHNNPELYTPNKSFKIHNTKLVELRKKNETHNDRTEKGNKQYHNYNGRL